MQLFYIITFVLYFFVLIISILICILRSLIFAYSKKKAMYAIKSFKQSLIDDSISLPFLF